MRNGDEILHQFLLGRQRFGIHNYQFCLLLLAHMFEQSKPEANQPILMGNDDASDFSRQNRVNQFEKAFALEIETSADFDEPLAGSFPSRSQRCNVLTLTPICLAKVVTEYIWQS